MKLSKKDVAGIVATLSKDATRPGMCQAAYCARQEVVFATDGHRLAVVRQDLARPPKGGWPELTWSTDTIYPIPRAALESAAKSAKKNDVVELRAHPTGVDVVSGRVTIAVWGGDAAVFPPMLRALDAAKAGKKGTPIIGVNADYLADAITLASDATSSQVIMRFGPSELDPMRVESPDGRIVVLIMPVRRD